MFKLFRNRKQIKKVEEKADNKYPIKLELTLRTVYLRSLTVANFLSSGVPISFFKERVGIGGLFARIQEMMSQSGENKELSEEQKKAIESVLTIGVKDYSNDWLEIEKIIVFNYIIMLSCEKFADVVYPDKNTALNCHYLAKNYGGEPWQYLNQSLDRFGFNIFCLNLGINDETNAMKKAMKRNPIK